MKLRSMPKGSPPGAGSVSCFCNSSTRDSLSVDSPARVGSTPPSVASLRPNSSASASVTSAAAPEMLYTPAMSGCAARHAEQRQHRAAARRLPGDRDPGGVAAERRDVVAHPLEGEQPVEHATVHRGIRDPAEAVEAEAVRDRHGDDAVAVERRAVVPGARGGAREVAAAVDVDEHRQRGIRRRIRREDVDVEGGLAGHRRLGDERHAGVAALGRRSERGRVAHVLPRGVRHGGREAEVADGGLGERDAEEGRRAVARGIRSPTTADAAGDGVDLDEGLGSGEGHVGGSSHTRWDGCA